MKAIRNLIWLIVLLQLANISVDPVDMNRHATRFINHSEDLSINKMESVYEWVAEGLFDNNVPENDENQIDTSLKLFQLFSSQAGYTSLPTFISFLSHSSFYLYPLYQTDFTPKSPPPKQFYLFYSC